MRIFKHCQSAQLWHASRRHDEQAGWPHIARFVDDPVSSLRDKLPIVGSARVLRQVVLACSRRAQIGSGRPASPGICTILAPQIEVRICISKNTNRSRGAGVREREAGCWPGGCRQCDNPYRSVLCDKPYHHGRGFFLGSVSTLLAVFGVALTLTDSPAPPDTFACLYEDVRFSPGASVQMGGGNKVCFLRDGLLTWERG